MKTFAFIITRGGSKGLLRKNILEIGGIPLIVHSIELAKRFYKSITHNIQRCYL